MVLLGVLVITVMVDANTNNLIQAITSVHNDLHTNLASLDQRYQEDAAATQDQINTIWQTLDINISRQVDVKMDELIKSLQAKVEVDISSVCELPKYNIKEIRRQLESLKDKVKDKEQSQAVRLQRLTDEILNQIKVIESKVSSVVPLLSKQCQQDVEEMQHQIERLDFVETLDSTRDGTDNLAKVLAGQSLTQPDDREPLFGEDYYNNTVQYFNSNVSWYQTLNQLSSCSNQVAPVILKMSNVSEKMKNKEEWFSEPFFAFKGGYKLLIKTKNSLSVSLHLMKGPHDDELQKSGHFPLRGTFVIELLNQLNDINHIPAYFYMRENKFYQSSDHTTLVGLTEFDKCLLTNNDYIVNDSVYFRVDYDCVC